MEEGNLHSASQKGWEAASSMAMAVAEANNWQYVIHEEFSVVLYNAKQVTGDDRMRVLGAVANGLHDNHFVRKLYLDAEDIRLGLTDMGDLLDILEPLTGVEAS